jgi:quercetin dioxygenase-like cupin family protein
VARSGRRPSRTSQGGEGHAVETPFQCLRHLRRRRRLRRDRGRGPRPTQGQPSGLTRKVLSERDVPNSNYKAVQVAAEIAAGFVVARHTHPGIESAYVLEGEAELSVDGQPDRKIQANDAFQIPPNRPHGVRNGGKATKLAITYVVEKDKPLASPA